MKISKRTIVISPKLKPVIKVTKKVLRIEKKKDVPVGPRRKGQRYV